MTTDVPLTPQPASLDYTPDDTGTQLKTAACLIPLLQAQKARQQAMFAIERVNDELRRYQKFARPGAPSSHVVQLRRQQAVARQAASVSKQSFIKAATAFVREAGLAVPPRVPLEVFITAWLAANVTAESSHQRDG